MNILAIETTGAVASCALVCADRTIAEFSVNNKLTHSQTLMPMIDQMLSSADFNKGDIGLVAASCGPGSFTGLRIGVAAAKGLAFGLGLKIVPVSTLDALAYNVLTWEGIIVPIMDARRNQVYTALYDCVGGKITRLSEYMACDVDEIIDTVRETGKNAIFLGDGAIAFRDKIAADGFCVAPNISLLQSAASVGAIALEIASDAAIDANKFEPFYIRPSQAERLASES